MARDDADEGRRDAPWDFDLPDLGASATPEHHRRRRGDGPSKPSAPQPRQRRRSSDDPLDFEALDDDPIDQDDDDLIPHSASDLSTHGSRSVGPQLPDDVSDDDDVPRDFSSGGGPAGSDSTSAASVSASGSATGGRSQAGAGSPDDDLLPAWATGRPARRRASGSAAGASSAPGQTGRPASSRGTVPPPHDERWDDERLDDGRRNDRGRDDGHRYESAYDDRGESRFEDQPEDWGDDRYEGWDERDEQWADDRDEASPPLWRRLLADPARLVRFLVPVALVLLVISLVILIMNSLGGESQEDPEPGAAATEAAQAEDPFDGFSARPEGETTDGASGPAARACGDDLSVSGSTDETTYGEDADPILIMTLENTGDEPCMVNAGTARMDYTVTSGSETVFDSEHCQIEGQDRPIELEPGQTESARMEWNRQRSAPGCAEDLEPAGPGGYELEVSLGESTAEPVEFTLE